MMGVRVRSVAVHAAACAIACASAVLLAPPVGAASASPSPLTQGPALPCLVEPQTNDRCPLWVSSPYRQPAGQDWLGPPGFRIGFPDGRLAASSPDGSLIYAVGTVASGVTYACSVLGTTASVPGEDIVVVAVSVNDGSTRWQRIIGPLGADTEAAGVAIAASPDGSRVFVVGSAAPPCQAAHEVTAAVDSATGGVDWLDELPSADLVASLGTTLAVSPDGRHLYVAGSGYVGPHPTHATGYVRALSADNGAQVWRVYAGSGWTSADAVALTPKGTTQVIAGFDDHAFAGAPVPIDEVVGTDVVDYNASTGALRWFHHDVVDGAGGITDIAAAPDGSRVFTLTCDRNAATGQNASRTVAFASAGGGRLWELDYPGQNNTACPSNGGNLLVSPDGSRIYQAVIALAPSPPLTDRLSSDAGAVVTLAADAATGSVEWQTVFQQVSAEGSVLTEASDGGAIYMAAQDGSCGNCIPPPQFVTVSYDPRTGTQRWQAEYGNAISAARAVVAPSGRDRIIVVGDEDQCGPDNLNTAVQAEAIVAIAYDGPGAQPGTPGVGGLARADAVNCQLPLTAPVASRSGAALPPAVVAILVAVGVTARAHRRRVRERVRTV